MSTQTNSNTTKGLHPTVIPTEFKTRASGAAAWHQFRRKLCTYMAANNAYWTTIIDPDDRIAVRAQNPWTTANTVEGRSKRADHLNKSALCLSVLEQFSTVPRAKERVAKYTTSQYFEEAAYHTGEPYLPGTELLITLDHLFSPVLQGEIDNALEKIRETMKTFPGLTRQDALNDGAILQAWIDYIRQEWALIMFHDDVRTQEAGLYGTMRRTVTQWEASDANKQGLNLAYIKEIFEAPEQEAAADKTICKCLDVFEAKLRQWLENYGSKPTIKALATTTSGPCVFCDGPNHNVADCNKLKAFKMSQDGAKLARNHNPKGAPGARRFGQGRGQPQQHVRFGAQMTIPHRGGPNPKRGGYYNGRGRGRGIGGYNRTKPARSGSFAPPGHPYKGKNFNPNHQKVTANTAGVAAAAPPNYAPPQAAAVGANSGLAPAPQPGASGPSNLSNILNANWPGISVNHVTVSDNTDAVSISDDDKPSYCDIFGESDDDDELEDAMLEDADIEDNANDDMDNEEALSMTSEHLDEAHNAFLATIEKPKPAPNINKTDDITPQTNEQASYSSNDSDSSVYSLPPLIRSSSSDASDNSVGRRPSPIQTPHSSSSEDDDLFVSKTSEGLWKEGKPFYGCNVDTNPTKWLPQSHENDECNAIVNHITDAIKLYYDLRDPNEHLPGFPKPNPIHSYDNWIVASIPEPRYLHLEGTAADHIKLFALYWDTLIDEQKTWFSERAELHALAKEWTLLEQWQPLSPPAHKHELTYQIREKDPAGSEPAKLDQQP